MERFKATWAEVVYSYIRFYVREFCAHFGEIVGGIVFSIFIISLPILAALFT